MIFFFEDELGIREALATFLRMQGYEICCAGSHREGEDLLAGSLPDALITDVDLGDGDGRDLVDEIRERSREIPVLLLSAREMSSMEPWLDSHRGVRVLEKPVLPSALLSWLRELEDVGRKDTARTVVKGGPGGASRVETELAWILSRLYRQPPLVTEIWREGPRVRARITGPARADHSRKLSDGDRERLLDLDPDFWPGSEACTELSFLLPQGSDPGPEEEKVAAFRSIPEPRPPEKVHEEGACSAPALLLRGWRPARVPGSVESNEASALSTALSRRLSAERRALWPEAGLWEVPEVLKRSSLLKENKGS